MHLIGWGTLLGFPFLGLIIGYFFPVLWSWENIFWFDSLAWNIVLGLAYGTVIGQLAVWMIAQPFMERVKAQYAPMVQQLNLTMPQIVFLSFCAGIGEEIFFRGFMQQLAGVWITAIIFVAIHGYLNPKNKAVSIYGICLTIAMAGIGYMTEYLGLISAILAHTMIDVVIFLFLTKANPQIVNKETE